ncbi:hypothetical protein BHE74_00026238, partial [Ensete ventricosum]
MAATHGFLRALLPDPLLSSSSNAEAAAAPKKLLHCPCPSRTSLPISRRDALLISVLPLGFVALPLPSQARERRGRKAIAPEEYSTSREFPLPILRGHLSPPSRTSSAPKISPTLSAVDDDFYTRSPASSLLQP